MERERGGRNDVAKLVEARAKIHGRSGPLHQDSFSVSQDPHDDDEQGIGAFRRITLVQYQSIMKEMVFPKSIITH